MVRKLLIVLCIITRTFIAAQQCDSDLKPGKLSVVAVWSKRFDNGTTQYRLSDEDLTGRGYTRIEDDKASSTALLARHPQKCVVSTCAIRLSAFLEPNGAVLHTDQSTVRNKSSKTSLDDVFYCAKNKGDCDAYVPVYRLVKHSRDGPQYAYALSDVTLSGFEREFAPICYGWRHSPSVLVFNQSDNICLPLPEVKHGTVTYSTSDSPVHEIGTTATLRCDSTFAASGQSSLMCTNKGWYPSKGLGACVPQKPSQALLISMGNSVASDVPSTSCKAPTNIQNGNVVYPSGTVDGFSRASTTASVWCDVGYVATSTTTSKCVDGQWDPTLTSCVSMFDIRCPILPDPDDGELSFAPAPYIEGSSVSLHCNKEFFVSGNKTAKCNNGTWSASIGTCRPLATGASCFALNVVNGMISYAQANLTSLYASGTTAFLMCNLGYLPSGSSSSLCSNGNWQPTLGSCVTSSSALNMGSAGASCLDIAQPTNGVVTYVPVTLVSGNHSSGSTATLTCNIGYSLTSGSLTSTCSNGIWSPLVLGTCSSSSSITTGVTQCTNPSVANGQLTYSQGTVFDTSRAQGTTATLTCNSGYTLSGNSISTCLTGGAWTPLPGTCLASSGTSSGASCIGILAPIGGTLSYVPTTTALGTYSSGTVVTLTCSGSLPSGASTATCNNGMWSTTLGTCSLSSTGTGSCTAITVPTGATASYSTGTSTTYNSGTTVTVTCSSGGNLLGIASCISGTWLPAVTGTCGTSSSSTSCVLGMGVPVNGNVTYSSGQTTAPFTSGTIATATCTNGMISGTALATCSNGQWSPTTFGTCSSSSSGTSQCSALTVPLGSTATYSSGTSATSTYSTGTTASVACSNGTIIGMSTCLLGTWTPSITASCTGTGTSTSGMQCVSTITPTNGNITYSDNNFSILHNSGATATLTCTGGTVTGTALSTCSNGVWSPALGTCSSSSSSALCWLPPTTTSMGATISYSTGSYFAPWNANTVAIMSCPSGQTVSGTSQATCLSGTWTPSFGTCLSSGTSTASGCSAASLGAISSQTTNGQTIYTPAVSTTVAVGTVASVVCFSGYRLTGNQTATCTSTGWQPNILGTCVLGTSNSTSTCQALSVPANGFVNYSQGSGTNFPVGTVATVNCSSNYTVSGASSTTCSANGTWYPSAGICVNTRADSTSGSCLLGMSPVLNGNLVYSNNRIVGPYPTGTLVTATCNTPFIASGTMTSLCTNGVWAPASLGTCNAVSTGISTGLTCAAIVVPNGVLMYSSLSAPYSSGTVATLFCNLGYRNIGGTSSTCTNGLWSPVMGSCTTLARAPPHNLSGVIDNAAQKTTIRLITAKTEVNTESTTQSAKKYLSISKSNSILSEKFDDDITDITAVTQGAACPTPLAPAFGEITFSTQSNEGMFPSATTAALKCTFGYSSVGPTFSTCRNGSFRPILGKCVNGEEPNLPGICVPVAPPRNGRITYIQSGRSLDFEEGTTALLYCEDGFAVTGEATLQCSGGEWQPANGFGSCDSTNHI